MPVFFEKENRLKSGATLVVLLTPALFVFNVFVAGVWRVWVEVFSLNQIIEYRVPELKGLMVNLK